MNPWASLFIAGLFEVAWAVGLKFTGLWPRLLTIAAMVISFSFLAQALKGLPLGTAYAIWTGIGTIGTVAVGVVVFGEPATILRFGCVALILSGIIGLKLTTAVV